MPHEVESEPVEDSQSLMEFSPWIGSERRRYVTEKPDTVDPGKPGTSDGCGLLYSNVGKFLDESLEDSEVCDHSDRTKRCSEWVLRQHGVCVGGIAPATTAPLAEPEGASCTGPSSGSSSRRSVSEHEYAEIDSAEDEGISEIMIFEKLPDALTPLEVVKHDCPFKQERSSMFNYNFACCELGSWVRPTVVRYDKSWFLMWAKNSTFCHNVSLTAYLQTLSMGKVRDAAIELTLLRSAKVKMLNELNIHPTWVVDVLIGSAAMAMKVGPREKAATGLTKPMVSSGRKNWIIRSTKEPLRPVMPAERRGLFQEVGTNRFVRKWIYGERFDRSVVG